MVYNDAYSGLNTLLCDPKFALPTIWFNLWVVKNGTYMKNQDIGEMFLNFVLSEEVRPFCVFDVSNVCT